MSISAAVISSLRNSAVRRPTPARCGYLPEWLDVVVVDVAMVRRWLADETAEPVEAHIKWCQLTHDERRAFLYLLSLVLEDA